MDSNWSDSYTEDDMLCDRLSDGQISILKSLAADVDNIVSNRKSVCDFLDMNDRVCVNIESGSYSIEFEKLSGVIAYHLAEKASEPMISVMESLVPGCRFRENEVAALLFMYSLANQRCNYLSFAEWLNVFQIDQFCKRASNSATLRFLKAPHTSLINHSDEGTHYPKSKIEKIEK